MSAYLKVAHFLCCTYEQTCITAVLQAKLHSFSVFARHLFTNGTNECCKKECVNVHWLLLCGMKPIFSTPQGCGKRKCWSRCWSTLSMGVGRRRQTSWSISLKARTSSLLTRYEQCFSCQHEGAFIKRTMSGRCYCKINILTTQTCFDEPHLKTTLTIISLMLVFCSEYYAYMSIPCNLMLMTLPPRDPLNVGPQ